MSSVATPLQPPFDDLIVKLNKRTKRMTVVLIVLAILLVLSAVSGFFVARWKLRAMEKAGGTWLSVNQFSTEINQPTPKGANRNEHPENAISTQQTT